jgi:hypothetical protein
MKFLRFLLCFVLAVPLFAFSCKDKEGNTIKPSTIVVAAQAFAIEPTSLRAALLITEILEDEKEISVDTARNIYTSAKIIQESFRSLREAITNQEWDRATTLKDRLLFLVDEFKRQVDLGTLGVKNPTSKLAWSSFATALRPLIESIDKLVVSLKPLPQFIERESQKPRATENNTLTTGSYIAIALIGTNVSFDIGLIRKETDTVKLYQQAQDVEAQVFAFLSEKLR